MKEDQLVQSMYLDILCILKGYEDEIPCELEGDYRTAVNAIVTAIQAHTNFINRFNELKK